MSLVLLRFMFTHSLLLNGAPNLSKLPFMFLEAKLVAGPVHCMQALMPVLFEWKS